MINKRPFPNWGLQHEIGNSNDNEDNIILSFFENKKIERKRLVVDIGAADGLTGSNSRKLINEYGWNGILIEPLTTFYNFLMDLYSNNQNVSIYNVACSTTNQNSIIYYSDNQSKIGLSSLLQETSLNQNLNKKQEVQTKKFNNIIKIKEIDFLSLDTEGKYFDILKDIDYDEYKIGMICTERWVDHDDDYNNLISDFLKTKNFSLYQTTSGNLIYCNDDIRI
jgi:FkbM family methyltransferase